MIHSRRGLLRRLRRVSLLKLLGLERPRSPLLLATGVAAIVSFVLITGVTAALTVPAVALDAEKPLAGMLPTSTAFFVSADLNPDYETGILMGNVGRGLTGEQAWKPIGRRLNAWTWSARQSCGRHSAGKPTRQFPDLGHQSAVAIVGGGGVPDTSRTLIDRMVVVAPLAVRMTLVDAIAEFAFSRPKQAFRYDGVSVFREKSPSCGLTKRFLPKEYYASVVKGYIVLAAGPFALERVLDVATGSAPSLAGDPMYERLAQALPIQPFGAFFLNGRLLGHAPRLAQTLRGALSGSPFSQVIGPRLHTAAGAVEPTAGGVAFSLARPDRRSAHAVGPNSGFLASELPESTSWFASFQADGAQRPLEGLSRFGVQSRLGWLLAPVRREARGEIDVFGWRWARLSSGRWGSIGSIYLQTNRGRRGMARLLAHAIRRHSGHRLHWFWRTGSILGVLPSGYGFVAGDHWAMVSTHVAATMQRLGTPAQPLTAGSAFLPPAWPGSAYSFIWYTHVHGRFRWRAIRALRWQLALRPSSMTWDLSRLVAPRAQTVSAALLETPYGLVWVTKVAALVPPPGAAARPPLRPSPQLVLGERLGKSSGFR